MFLYKAQGWTRESRRTAAPGVLARRGRAIGVEAGGGRAVEIGIAARAAEQGQQVAAAAVCLHLIQSALALPGARTQGLYHLALCGCAGTGHKLASASPIMPVLGSLSQALPAGAVQWSWPAASKRKRSGKLVARGFTWPSTALLLYVQQFAVLGTAQALPLEELAVRRLPALEHLRLHWK